MSNSKLSILFCCSTVFFVRAAEKPVVEVEGCFALSSFAGNLKISMIEKVSFVTKINTAVSIFGEQSFRNNSFINSLFAGAEYRFGNETMQVPLGLFGGIYDVHIGQYSTFLPVAGTNTGIIVWFNEIASLRINYCAKLYFDKEVVFGNDLLVGFAVAFGK